MDYFDRFKQAQATGKKKKKDKKKADFKKKVTKSVSGVKKAFKKGYSTSDQSKKISTDFGFSTNKKF